ncbi:MAG: PQQ-binding-like beta-propeller repeat protein [Polyangiaceae bacterium]|nr:PQQ-binding-like beta-propeller repeat protein [Polyangiaceae bacterium]
MSALAIGFAVMFFAKMDAPDGAPPRPRPDGRAIKGAPSGSAGEAKGAVLEVYLEDLGFVDAGGDDALDPVVWAAEGVDRVRAAAIDGKTGQGLWATPASPGRGPLVAADRATVLAGAEDRSVRALDARTGKVRWTASVPGAPEEIVVGEGCVTVTTKDGGATGLRLDTGEAAPCASAPRPAPLTGAFWDRARNPQIKRDGDLEVALTAKAPGTPVLSVEARRGGAPLWRRDLLARAPGTRPDMLLALSDGTAVIAGADVATGQEPRLIGVEIASGKVLYERPASWSGSYVAALEARGPRVYVIAGGALRAVEPATGAELWRAAPPPALP